MWTMLLGNVDNSDKKSLNMFFFNDPDQNSDVTSKLHYRRPTYSCSVVIFVDTTKRHQPKFVGLFYEMFCSYLFIIATNPNKMLLIFFFSSF